MISYVMSKLCQSFELEFFLMQSLKYRHVVLLAIGHSDTWGMSGLQTVLPNDLLFPMTRLHSALSIDCTDEKRTCIDMSLISGISH